MNKLELCKRILDEADRDSDLLTTTVLADLSEPQHRKVVGWLDGAYSSLQSEQRYWKFHHQTGLMFELNVGQNSERVPNLKSFLADSFAMAFDPDDTSRQDLTFLDFQDFRQVNRLTPNLTGTPRWITRIPSGEFSVYPTPTAKIYVYADWYITSATMLVNCDEPIWDEDLHEILVWMALRSYAHAYVVPDLLERVNLVLPQMKRQFLNRYLDDTELCY